MVAFLYILMLVSLLAVGLCLTRKVAQLQRLRHTLLSQQKLLEMKRGPVRTVQQRKLSRMQSQGQQKRKELRLRSRSPSSLHEIEDARRKSIDLQKAYAQRQKKRMNQTW